MSHTDELEEYDAELELRLKKEYADVFPLFRFCVLTQEATYLCNRSTWTRAAGVVPAVPPRRWRTSGCGTRTARRASSRGAEFHTTQDVTVEELRPPESTPPLEPPTA